jgi:methylglutamate dehydrogenase subunit C
VLATGAFERPLVFPGNDRPGVMLAGAAERYAVEYGVLPGDRFALFTNNDGAYRAALCAEAPVPTSRRSSTSAPHIAEAARALATKAGAEVLTGHAVVATKAPPSIRQITVQPFDAASGGCRATAHHRCRRPGRLGRLVAGDPSRQPGRRDSRAGTRGCRPSCRPSLTRKWHGAGAFTGAFTTQEAIVEGIAAGRRGGRRRRATPRQVDAPDLDVTPAPVLEIRRRTGKAFVDFQHDVTAEDVRLAHREGFVSVEHLKRYTTLGMATDQGRTSNVPGWPSWPPRAAFPSRGRHHPLPPALLAGVDRRAGRRTLWRVEARPADADA